MDGINLTKIYVILDYFIKLISDYLSKLQAMFSAGQEHAEDAAEPAGDEG